MTDYNTTVQTQLALFVYEASNVRHSQRLSIDKELYICSAPHNMVNQVTRLLFVYMCIPIQEAPCSYITCDANKIRYDLI
jgi:hypothetical protein